MSDLLEKRFQQGIALCESHMEFAFRRGDYPGLTPPTLEEQASGLPEQECDALFTGYERALERYQMGVSDAHNQLQKARQKAAETIPQWQPRNVDRARKIAKLSTTCDCTQDWHDHAPGECRGHPTRFSLATLGANGPPGETERDRVERIQMNLLVLCRSCTHTPRGEGWFDIEPAQ
ncbi:MAG: hypothetical protein OXU74_06435 [Gemmatimonadota bacterium]|nr:hypothetical protein [Gemmatimonadota bacterium]